MFPHATGRWAQKIRGRMVYLGPWADPQAALDKYLAEKDALHAGKEPRDEVSGADVTVKAENAEGAGRATFRKGELQTVALSAYPRDDASSRCNLAPPLLIAGEPGMPNAPDPDPSVAASEADVRHPPSSLAPTHRQGAFSPRQAAMIAGTAYLLQYVTSVFPQFYVRPMLIVADDAARTASNIVANAQLFRVAIVCELLAGVFVVILNAALYELLAPVHRSLARFAAFWRLVEVSVGSALAASSFIVLSILSSAEPLQAFEPRERQGLAHLFVGAQASGYMIILLFFGLGSTTYMYLLVRSRYVPRALALVGLLGSAGVVLFALIQMPFPAFVAAAVATVRGLPPVALALVVLVLAPILLFEFALGLWLLVKGVRTARSPRGG